MASVKDGEESERRGIVLLRPNNKVRNLGRGIPGGQWLDLDDITVSAGSKRQGHFSARLSPEAKATIKDNGSTNHTKVITRILPPASSWQHATTHVSSKRLGATAVAKS